jgi:preprotein translocase subunit SecD
MIAEQAAGRPAASNPNRDTATRRSLPATGFSTLMRVPIIVAGVDLLAVIVVAAVYLTRRRATPRW